MKYVVAVIGFILVFAVVYIVVCLGLIMWSPGFLVAHFPSAVQGVNNPVGIVLALIAGGSSFRASVKKGTKTPHNKTGAGDVQ